MASKSGTDFFGDSCANCKIFNWEQVDPTISPLKRCTGCYKISYCSKECQEEHWHKVHKRHCKYFSGKKPLEESDLHKKETCGRCIKQEAAGRKVFKEENPTYVCPYDPNLNSSNFAKVNSFLRDKYPMPSRESPSSRFERTLDVLQSILLKIKVTKQPIFRLYPREVELIADELEKMRAAIFKAAVFPSNYPFFADLGDLGKLLTPDLRSVGARDPYQMWASFLILFELLLSVGMFETDRVIKNPEKSLPEKERKVSEMVRGGGASAYLRKVDKILEALEEKLVSQENLAAIVCEGNLLRACSTCGKEVTIRAVFTRGSRIEGTPSVLLRPTSSDLFSCGHSDCSLGISPEVIAWTAAVSATFHKLWETKCDNCFLLAPAQDVHRSRCLTKNYCSKECFAADEAVHAVCCKNKQEVDKRKVKIGGKAKARMVNQNLEAYRVKTRQEIQNANFNEETSKLMTEAFSKIRGLKVKDGKKEEEMPEVD